MTSSPFKESRDSIADMNEVLCLPSSPKAISDLNGVGVPALPPPPPRFLSPMPAADDVPLLSLSLNTPGVDSEIHSGGGSGSGLRVASQGDGVTWTTLNPGINVVDEVQSQIEKWIQVYRFINSPSPSSDEVSQSAQAEGSAVKGEVGDLIQLPGIAPVNITKTATVCLPSPPKARIRDFSKLNRSDFAELDHHGFLLGERQQRHLKAVEKKQQLFPKRFRQAEYLPQSAIMLLSHGWASAERYACCGMRNKGNPSGTCKLHKYCPYCCWRERYRYQLTYVPAFDSGTWHWVTGSFTGELTMDPTAPMESANEWLNYWDGYKSAFINWVKGKSVRGVFWVEELAVNSLLPTKVLPHVHAIVEAELQALDHTLNTKLRAFLGPDYMEPNIEVRQISTARSLMDRIGYMLKPFDILTAYQKAWCGASFHNRHLAQQLNNQATDLVLGYSHLTTDRKKMNVKGSLDSKTSSFIGISKGEREQHRGTLAAIKADAHDEYMEMGEEEQQEELGFAGPESTLGPLPVHPLPPEHQGGSLVPSRTKEGASRKPAT